MKKYLADTNIFLRLFLNDNKKQAKIAENYLSQAKTGKIKIILLPEIVFEINYVLEKVYFLKKTEIIKFLSSLVKTPYLEVLNLNILLKTITLYEKEKIDLIDAYIFSFAEEENAKILSFDEDFKKLK